MSIIKSRSKSILLVDDEPDIVNLFKYVHESRNWLDILIAHKIKFLMIDYTFLTVLLKNFYLVDILLFLFLIVYTIYKKNKYKQKSEVSISHDKYDDLVVISFMSPGIGHLLLIDKEQL